MLHLKDILLTRGKQALLRGVSLHVPRGLFTLVTGPNPSGKSMLLRVAAGLKKPAIGQVTLCGEDIFAMPDTKRSPRLFYCAGDMNLDQLCNQYAAQPLLILDDPFRCLDTQAREEALLTLKAWQSAKGLTILLAAADPAPYLAYADRIALLQSGKLVQQGTPEDVYLHPADLFAAQYFGHCNVLEGVISGVDIRKYRAALDVDGLTLECPARAHTEVGDKAALCIRAEHMHVSAQPVPFGQNISGVIVENTHRFSLQRVRVQLPSGQILCSIRQQEVPVKLETGRRAFLYWDADKSLLF